MAAHHCWMSTGGLNVARKLNWNAMARMQKCSGMVGSAPGCQTRDDRHLVFTGFIAGNADIERHHQDWGQWQYMLTAILLTSVHIKCSSPQATSALTTLNPAMVIQLGPLNLFSRTVSSGCQFFYTCCSTRQKLWVYRQHGALSGTC